MLCCISSTTIAATPACITRSTFLETKAMTSGCVPSLYCTERMSMKSLLSIRPKRSPSIFGPPSRQFLCTFVSGRLTVWTDPANVQMQVTSTPPASIVVGLSNIRTTSAFMLIARCLLVMAVRCAENRPRSEVLSDLTTMTSLRASLISRTQSDQEAAAQVVRQAHYATHRLLREQGAAGLHFRSAQMQDSSSHRKRNPSGNDWSRAASRTEIVRACSLS